MKQLFLIEMAAMKNEEFSHGFDLGFVSNEDHAKGMVSALSQREDVKKLGYKIHYQPVCIDDVNSMHIKISNQLLNENSECENTEKKKISHDEGELYNVNIIYSVGNDFSHSVNIGVFESDAYSESRALENLINTDLFLVKNQDMISLEKVKISSRKDLEDVIENIIF